MLPITFFHGEHRFLSNFYQCQIVVKSPRACGPTMYPTVEHAFQAAKSLSADERTRIAAAPTPGIAKRMGRRVKIRPDWDSVRVDVMRYLLRQKFSGSPWKTQEHELRDRLLATGDAELIEGNTWGDRFWGQCPVGVGENMLGRLLMEVRTELRAAAS